MAFGFKNWAVDTAKRCFLEVYGFDFKSCDMKVCVWFFRSGSRTRGPKSDE
jgi:hypothetical protein